MFCTLSGKVPTSPVVNRKTGRLYERRLIEKALQETGGKCPETDEPITADDLIPLLPGTKGPKPGAVNAADLASVPAVLSHLQNQWDAADLERQQLRRSLRDTRQELASALYRLDAAIRAIARLRADAPATQPDTTKPAAQQNGTDAAVNAEKDAPAAAAPATPDKEIEQPVSAQDGNGQPLEKHTKEPEKSSTNPASTDAKDEDMVAAEKVVEATEGTDKDAAPKSRPAPADAMTERSVAAQSSEERGAETSTPAPAPTLWPAELVAATRELEAKLFAKRKARVVPSDWAPAEDVARFSVSATASVRDGDKGGDMRGCVADLVTVMGDDGRETAFAAWRGGRVGGIRTKPMVDCGGCDDAHTGGATAVWADAAFPGTVLSGGEDGVVQVWDSSADWKSVARYGGSDGPVVGLQRHPVGSVALVGRTYGWEWREVEGGAVVACGSSGDDVGYTGCAVHPDGRLFAMGRCDGAVELVDANGMKVVERLGGGGGDVRGIVMSEKGYQMAVGDGEAVRLWDLRKHKDVGEVRLDGRGRGVALDGMGEYGVAVADGMAAMFQAKKKTRVMGRVPVVGGGGGGRVGVAWSASARSVLLGCDNGDVLKLGAM